VLSGNVEEEFNKGFILPPLIVQLRKILDQYPDDTQILRVSRPNCLFPVLSEQRALKGRCDVSMTYSDALEINLT